MSSSDVRMAGLAALVAALCLVPTAEYMLGADLPLAGVLWLPNIGLTYLAVFFHEIGHAVTSWSFGMPALPTFDFDEGGGMTYSFSPHISLQICFYALLLAAGIWLWKNGYHGLAIAAGVLFFFHAAVSVAGEAEALTAFMGMGGEAAIGAFCLFRAMTGTTSGGRIERFLNVVFSFFILGRSLILAASFLIAPDVADTVTQKRHIAGDVQQIAAALPVSPAAIGVFAACFSFALFAAAGYLARRDLSPA